MDATRTVVATPVMPRIFINSFPKSGTHLANLICMHLARRQEPKYWLGSFSGNSWTVNWIGDENILPVINGQPKGTWYQGHIGHRESIEEAFSNMGVCMLFVYRDLRDVAISQTYHIESDNDEKAKHPNKKLYWDMPSHEDRIGAVIEGIDDFAGVIDRWELYAPWLNVDWVLPVRYEDIRQDSAGVAKRVVDYIIERTVDNETMQFMLGGNISDAVVKSIELMSTTEYSPSFRKGKVNNWKSEFTPEIKELFKEKAGDWLVKLGYEETNDW